MNGPSHCSLPPVGPSHTDAGLGPVTQFSYETLANVMQAEAPEPRAQSPVGLGCNPCLLSESSHV